MRVPSCICQTGLSGTRGTCFAPPRDFCLDYLDYLDSSNISNHSFAIMPRKRKDCPICGKQGLLKLSNHLADFHQLSSRERQSYLMQARIFPLDINALLNELIMLRQKVPVKERPKKWYKLWLLSL